MSWGDPGVTEQQMILEDSIMCPGAEGGVKTQTLQRAGYLKKLRIMAEAEIEQTAAGTAPVITAYGPFAGLIRRLRIEAAGRQPLFTASGLGATIYNEIQNKDGSVLATPAFGATFGLTAAAPLVEYTAPGTAAQSYVVKFPLEFAFSLPVFVKGVAQELGLWLLQDRSVDLGIEVEFNAPIDASAANVDRLYSGGATLAATYTLAATMLRIERELYAVPGDPKDRPPEMWAHQVTEYEEAIAGKKFRFDIPAAGLILRAVIIVLDSSGDVVEYTDIDNISVIYGTNVTPVRRPGWAMVQEYLQDYGRYPPKGVVVNDMYKWGMDTLKLAKDSEALANFRIEGTFTATTSGKVLILLDTLQRVLRAG
ncbi:hypothetical protein LCGC14_0711070 [marine sediment metagenome]|uniref:Uncharacterized protein n=1 Tax=marine sediment metagenome TaxID=412755 RepID=A0A0F9QEY8_9ZZZZ